MLNFVVSHFFSCRYQTNRTILVMCARAHSCCNRCERKQDKNVDYSFYGNLLQYDDVVIGGGWDVNVINTGSSTVCTICSMKQTNKININRFPNIRRDQQQLKKYDYACTYRPTALTRLLLAASTSAVIFVSERTINAS